MQINPSAEKHAPNTKTDLLRYIQTKGVITVSGPKNFLETYKFPEVVEPFIKYEHVAQ